VKVVVVVVVVIVVTSPSPPSLCSKLAIPVLAMHCDKWQWKENKRKEDMVVMEATKGATQVTTTTTTTTTGVITACTPDCHIHPYKIMVIIINQDASLFMIF